MWANEIQTLGFVTTAVIYLNQPLSSPPPELPPSNQKSLLVGFLIYSPVDSLIGSLAAAEPLWSHYVPTETQHVDISVTTER